MGVSLQITLAERFWPRVDFGPNDLICCWPWKGAHRGERGEYGTLQVGNRQRTASQVAWELAHGEDFPEGMEACHHCDNPRCVRPSHIFPGTRANNMQDALQKGRLRNHNSEKTVCSKGHPLIGPNLYVRLDGKGRECVTCRSEAARRYKQKQKARGLSWA